MCVVCRSFSLLVPGVGRCGMCCCALGMKCNERCERPYCKVVGGGGWKMHIKYRVTKKAITWLPLICSSVLVAPTKEWICVCVRNQMCNSSSSTKSVEMLDAIITREQSSYEAITTASSMCGSIVQHPATKQSSRQCMKRRMEKNTNRQWKQVGKKCISNRKRKNIKLLYDLWYNKCARARSLARLNRFVREPKTYYSQFAWHRNAAGCMVPETFVFFLAADGARMNEAVTGDGNVCMHAVTRIENFHHFIWHCAIFNCKECEWMLIHIDANARFYTSSR